MSSPRICVLVNPFSGKGRGARYARAAVARLRDAGCIVDTRVRRDGAEAEAMGRKAVRQRYDALVACGGDGLVRLAVQANAGTSIPLSTIRQAPATTWPATSICRDATRLLPQTW